MICSGWCSCYLFQVHVTGIITSCRQPFALSQKGNIVLFAMLSMSVSIVTTYWAFEIWETWAKLWDTSFIARIAKWPIPGPSEWGSLELCSAPPAGLSSETLLTTPSWGLSLRSMYMGSLSNLSYPNLWWKNTHMRFGEIKKHFQGIKVNK